MNPMNGEACEGMTGMLNDGIEGGGGGGAALLVLGEEGTGAGGLGGETVGVRVNFKKNCPPSRDRGTYLTVELGCERRQ